MKTLKAPPKLNLVEWADTYRYLSSESSSAPGRWRTTNVPCARGPMLAATDPKIKKITVMACTQLMKTELINNIVGYFIHQDPSPIIVMQPTGKMAEAWSKDRLDKMVRDTPVLRDLIAPKKGRDSENTILHKGFPGGHITIVSAGSPSDLAMRPVRIVLCDEVDKYDESAGNEGDPVKLIQERSATFWNKLHVLVCSPTIKDRSRIEKEYFEGDQRVFHVPCPHCGHAEEMQWEHVKWINDDPETAQYQCPSCTALWSEQERIEAQQYGYDVPTVPTNDHASFRYSKLNSPWEPLSELVKKYLESKDDQEMYKTFVNTQLAQTFQVKGEAPEHMRLYERREDYPVNTCPEGVVFLTAGVDVQKNRLECEIVGWARGKPTFSIDYRVLVGETSNIESQCWKDLDNILNETWILQNGNEIQLRVLAIDSGYNTQTVYNWARKYTGTNRVMVVKGQDHQEAILGKPRDMDVNYQGNKIRRGVKVWPVGVSTIKSELYGWLNLPGAGDDGIYPPGFCHFPQYNEDYFKGLTSEQLMKTKNKKGHTVYQWVKTYERNEPLDCRVYARAAAAYVGLDRLSEHEWDLLEGKFDIVKPKAKPVVETKDVPKVTEKPTKVEPQSQQSSAFWARQNKKKFW